jgi:hypothetical protein
MLVSRVRRSASSSSTTSSAPSTRTWIEWPSTSNGGVPKPPDVFVSAISLCGLRAAATISAATR